MGRICSISLLLRFADPGDTGYLDDACDLIGDCAEKTSGTLGARGVRSESLITGRDASTSARSSSLSSEPMIGMPLSFISFRTKGDRLSHRFSSISAIIRLFALFGDPKSSDNRLLPSTASGRIFSFSFPLILATGDPDPDAARIRGTRARPGTLREGEEGDCRRHPTGRGIPERLGRIAATLEVRFGGVLRLMEGERGNGMEAMFRRRGVEVRGTTFSSSSLSSAQRSITSFVYGEISMIEQRLVCFGNAIVSA